MKSVFFSQANMTDEEKSSVDASSITGLNPRQTFRWTYENDAWIAVTQEFPELAEAQCEEDEQKLESLMDEYLDRRWQQLTAEEVAEWQQHQEDTKHATWNELRKEGRLIENEESLAQKKKQEEEEKSSESEESKTQNNDDEPRRE
jgi:hypothetical protein